MKPIIKTTFLYIFSILLFSPMTACGFGKLDKGMLAAYQDGLIDKATLKKAYDQNIIEDNYGSTGEGTDMQASSETSGQYNESDLDSETEEHSAEPIEFLDPQYEWSQFENKKKGKAVIKTEGLFLESKENEGIIASVVELPISADTFAFTFGTTFSRTKPEEDKSIGLIFNYRNERNYQAVSVFKKGFQIEECVDGTISVIKRGLAKTNNQANTLVIDYQGGKMEVKLNGVDLTTVKNMTITSPILGVFISGKNSAILPNFTFSIPETNTESEQSTSDM